LQTKEYSPREKRTVTRDRGRSLYFGLSFAAAMSSTACYSMQAHEARNFSGEANNEKPVSLLAKKF
jgi:hypothetical protein